MQLVSGAINDRQSDLKREYLKLLSDLETMMKEQSGTTCLLVSLRRLTEDTQIILDIHLSTHLFLGRM